MADEKDAKLVTALRQAKQMPMFFAFVAKGTSEGTLLVSKKKIPIKEINQAKEATGGKKVIRGRCVGEDGKMVFEMAKEPPSTLAKQLKKVIQESAGMMLQVETRVAPDLAEEDEEGETEGQEQPSQPGSPPPAPPPPPQPGKDPAARFATRLKALTPVVQKVAATGSPLVKDAQAQIDEANKLSGAKQYDQANAALDRAESLVKQALASRPAAPPPPAKSDPAARFTVRLKALTPVVQKVQVIGSPQVKEAQLKLVEGNKLYLAKQYQPAHEALDRAEALIKEVLSSAPKPGAAPPPQRDEASMQAEWEQRVIEMEPRVLKASKTRANEAKWMTLFMSVQDLGEAGDFAKALGVLDKLEGLLNNPPAKGDKASEKGTPVAFTQARLQWDGARKTVQSELEKLERSILKTLSAIPQIPKTKLTELAASTKKLYTILDKLDGRLIDKLDEALNAKTPAARDALNQQAAALVKEYTAFVNGDPLVKDIDNNPFTPVNVQAHMVQTLNELAAKLG